jgi:MerR family transcriptional regulator, light-induced transcriptional regulator
LATYSIRDLENISGIKAHTLRMWEQRYDILQPKRTDTNIRFYDENDLRLLLSISTLNCNGFKISNIAKMTPVEIHMACHNLHTVCDEFAFQINALSLAMIELDEERFERAFSGCVLRHGFEDTMQRVIHPFFERVGLLWQTGAIKPVQEHFVSNIVRQKLIAAIDAQQPPRIENQRKYALFLPAFEQHELGLLFAAYMLRARGNKVIYLGQNVPADDLKGVCELLAPDYFLTVITMPQNGEVQGYVNQLAQEFPCVRVLVAGSAGGQVKAAAANVTVLQQISDLLRQCE